MPFPRDVPRREKVRRRLLRPRWIIATVGVIAIAVAVTGILIATGGARDSTGHRNPTSGRAKRVAPAPVRHQPARRPAGASPPPTPAPAPGGGPAGATRPPPGA